MVVIYYLAQAISAQHAIYAQRYDRLSEADKMGEPGRRLLQQMGELATRVIALYEKIRPGSRPDYVVPPRRVDPNRPEG